MYILIEVNIVGILIFYVVKQFHFSNPYNRKRQAVRLFWRITWLFSTFFLPSSLGQEWKRFILRCFGAKVSSKAVVYSSAKIFMPWNLEMHEFSCLASGVDCYNAAPIVLEAYATVSQRAYLCTASHNISSKAHEQIANPIRIEKYAWVAAEAFVGPGVTIGEGAVVGARSAVFRYVEPWSVVGGNPAKFLKKRVINGEG